MKEDIETLLSQIQKTVKKKIEQVKKRELVKRRKLQNEILDLKKLILGMVEGFCRIQQRIREDEEILMLPKPEDSLKDFIIKISQIYEIVAEKILRFSKEQEEMVEINESMTMLKEAELEQSEAKLRELQERYDLLDAAVKSYFGKEDLDQILELIRGGIETSSCYVSCKSDSESGSGSEEVLGFGSDVSSVGSVDFMPESPEITPVEAKLLHLAKNYDGKDKYKLIEKICSGTLMDVVLGKFLTKLAGGQVNLDLISEIKAMLKIKDNN